MTDTLHDSAVTNESIVQQAVFSDLSLVQRQQTEICLSPPNLVLILKDNGEDSTLRFSMERGSLRLRHHNLCVHVLRACVVVSLTQPEVNLKMMSIDTSICKNVSIKPINVCG